MIDLVSEELSRIIADKGETCPKLDRDTVLLSEGGPIDSLDLAVLVVALEERTGRQPFRAGFRLFRTLGELADLFAEEPS
jgi:acyl carrier protein